MSDSVKITIDGREIEVEAGELLIAAAQKHGTYIPRFCWHERMQSVGMCRMCLVEVEGPRGPTLTTACTMPCNDGMVVHTANDTVQKAREGVLEFLLINHPLDCPVCDPGGECPLQDQTIAYGPGESRFVEEKRHFEKPIPISDLVLLAGDVFEDDRISRVVGWKGDLFRISACLQFLRDQFACPFRFNLIPAISTGIFTG